MLKKLELHGILNHSYVRSLAYELPLSSVHWTIILQDYFIQMYWEAICSDRNWKSQSSWWVLWSFYEEECFQGQEWRSKTVILHNHWTYNLTKEVNLRSWFLPFSLCTFLMSASKFSHSGNCDQINSGNEMFIRISAFFSQNILYFRLPSD